MTELLLWHQICCKESGSYTAGHVIGDLYHDLYEGHVCLCIIIFFCEGKQRKVKYYQGVLTDKLLIFHHWFRLCSGVGVTVLLHSKKKKKKILVGTFNVELPLFSLHGFFIFLATLVFVCFSLFIYRRIIKSSWHFHLVMVLL